MHTFSSGRLPFDGPGLAAALLATLLAILVPNATAQFFDTPPVDVAGTYLTSLAWGDYDGDNDPDLLLAGCTGDFCMSPLTKLYRNDGGTLVEVPAPFKAAGAGVVRFVDLDGDDDLDVFVSGFAGLWGAHTTIYRNDGGSFSQLTTLKGMLGAAADFADYDGDDDLDLVLSGCTMLSTAGMTCTSPETILYENEGDGTFWAPATPWLAQLAVGSVSFQDIDGDNLPDLLLTGVDSSNDPHTVVYRNAPQGTFTEIPVGLTDFAAGQVAWADVDGDSRPDLALNGCTDSSCTVGGAVYRNTSTVGAFSFSLETNIPGTASGSLDAADVDRDGEVDLILTGCSDLDLNAMTCSTPVSSLLLGDGAFGFVDAGESLVGLGLSDAELADFNNDGKLDLALGGTTSDPDEIWGIEGLVYTGIGGPDPSAFTSAQILDGLYLASLDWGDYDGDGDLDLVVAGCVDALCNTAETTLYRYTGSGFVDSGIALDGAGGGVVKFADLDGDNDLDLFVSGSKGIIMGAHATVYENEAGGFWPQSSLGAFIGTAVAFGDVDNNGTIDMAVSGCTDIDVMNMVCNAAVSRIYQNDGDANFTDAAAGLTQLSIGSLALLDRENDGDLDLLQTGIDAGGTPTTILYDNVGGTFTDSGEVLPDFAGGDVAVADLDYDGDFDLLLSGCRDASCSTPGVNMLLNQGNGTFVASPEEAELFANAGGSIDTGDYNNDGAIDILITGCMTLDLAKSDCWGPATKLYDGDTGVAGEIALSTEVLTPVGISDAQFGDYDNDGKLDIALVGTTSDPNAVDGRHLEIYHGHAAAVNVRPNPPLAPLVAVIGDEATVTFLSPTPDDWTPTDALSYNLRVGTTPGGTDVLSPMALVDGQRLVAEWGNIQQNQQWTLENLPAGTYYMAVQAIDQAYAGSRFSNERAFIVEPVARFVDLTVDKTVRNVPNDPDGFVPGEEVLFDIRVSSANLAGAETVTTVIVDDILPAGLTYVPFSATTGPGITFNTVTHTWTIDAIEPGETVELGIRAVVDAWVVSDLENCAEIWDYDEHELIENLSGLAGALPGGALDPITNPADAEGDQDCTTVRIRGRQDKIDLELSKAADPSSAVVGDVVEFTLTLTNSSADGPVIPATNIIVRDYLPGSMSYVWDTATSPADDNRVVSVDQNSLTWVVSDLASDESITLSFQAVVNQTGTHVNAAEVWDVDQVGLDHDSQTGEEGGAYDPNAQNQDDEAEASVEVRPVAKKADLSLTKTVSHATPNVGDEITFTVTVTNTGAATEGVIIRDELVDGSACFSHNSSGLAFSKGMLAVESGGAYRWIVDVAAAASETFRITGWVTCKNAFRNEAEIVDSGTLEDASQGNDWAAASVDPVHVPAGKADLSLSKSVSNAYPNVGDEITFTVTVKNDGEATTGVVVKDIFDDSYGCFSYTTSGIGISKGAVTPHSNSTIEWTLDLAAYAQETLTITGWVGCDTPFTNNAEITDSGSKEDKSAGNDWASVTVDPKGTLPPPSDALCYLIADNDAEHQPSHDVLTVLYAGATQDVKVAFTGTSMIEAAAFNPWNRKLYAADARSLGIVDLNTGHYQKIGEFGSGWGVNHHGQRVERGFLDVDGLAFDPYSSDQLFGTVRKTGEPDLLIRIDPATGKAVKGAFGPGQDFVTIQGVHGLTDIDDIAISPWDGTLYAINNRDGQHSRLVTLDRHTGRALKVLDLPLGNVEGLAFYGDGTLYGTAGEGHESIVIIDLNTRKATVQAGLGAGGRDYESIDCLTNGTNRLSAMYYQDLNGDGIFQVGETPAAQRVVQLMRDVDGDRTGDVVVAETHTDASGNAVFEPAATGDFVLKLVEGGESAASVVGFGGQVEVGQLALAATSTSSESLSEVPGGFRIEGNYPNPFNPQTTIAFDIAETARVRLAVVDMLGRELAVLVDGQVSAGRHTAVFDAGNVPSGVYLVRMSTAEHTLTHSMTLIK
ncbi:MAG: VCBS repeat-containing protein [Rhodothermales bacterium]|nr:VCBS repeat-containing protein [Rhodothermales bacterium]MBO6778406.1 VCBS repeat-containing protein [Rhodothermales bacterium]